MLGTLQVELSRDGGQSWEPVIFRAAAPPSDPFPDHLLLPDGWRWVSVHEIGKPVRFVPMLDIPAGRACW